MKKRVWLTLVVCQMGLHLIFISLNFTKFFSHLQVFFVKIISSMQVSLNGEKLNKTVRHHHNNAGFRSAARPVRIETI